MRRDFAESLPERRATLETAWTTLQSTGWDEESLEAAYRVVHSLAGACETFGFTEAGRAARALNDHMHALVHQGLSPEEPMRQQARALYDTLREALKADERA